MVGTLTTITTQMKRGLTRMETMRMEMTRMEMMKTRLFFDENFRIPVYLLLGYFVGWVFCCFSQKVQLDRESGE